jgi:peptide/nickel transport system permease protein
MSAQPAARELSPGARLLATRLPLGLLTLFLASVVVFAATQVLPGDAARAVLGRTATPESLAALRAQLNLDSPPLLQYWQWLSGILTGDPGNSLVNSLPVLSNVLPRIANSLALMLITAVISVCLAIVLGIFAAVRRGVPDAALSASALAISATPPFVLGMIMIIIFATTVFHWFPAVSYLRPGESIWSTPTAIVLPVATLGLVVFPYVFRITRASMIDVLASDYIEMARLKDVPARRIIFRHALPNALAPVVQVIALTLAYLAGGVVAVEYVFGFPGIGQGLVDAINARDIPTIQFIVLALAAFYVAANIIADYFALMLTPRMRATGRRAA